MRASPSPKRRSRAWIWIVAGLGLVVVALILTVVTAPYWAAGMVREEVATRLHKRLELPVAIEDVELGWSGKAKVTGLSVGSEDGVSIELPEIVIELDGDELWGGRLHPRTVHVEGGTVRGSRAQLEELAKRLTKRREDETPREEGRVKLVPDALELEDVWLVVHEPVEDERDRRLETRLHGTANVAAKVATIELLDVRLDPGHGPILTANRIATDVSVVDRALQFPLTAEVEGLGAPVSEQIAVAGVDGKITLADAALSEVELDLAGGFSDRTTEAGSVPKLWSAAGRVRRDLSKGELRLSMEAFELGRIPQVLEQLPVVDSEGATVGGKLAVVFGSGVARVEGNLDLEGVNVHHRLLARVPVNDIGFALQFAAEVDPNERYVDIDHAIIERRGVRLELSGEAYHPPQREGRRYRLRANMPTVPCQSVLAAIPAELVPSMHGFELEGEFDAAVDVDIDYADLEELVLDGHVGISNCKARDVPARAAAGRLAQGFTHRVQMRNGQVRTVRMWTGSGSFTSLSSISPYMVGAVLTTEDGGFWRHRGFLTSQFKVALKRNLEAGQIELGASTITMQMVKNVLLSHERTLARKLQEMFLTWYVEQALPKSRIMEIYLNAIEYGPGIYGIKRAARHYFGKEPAALTPPEAVYLALMLPSPVRRHSHYCRGVLSPNFDVKVQRILRIMYERGKLTDLDYEVWRDTPIEFSTGASGSTDACLGRVGALRAGTHTQRALSGLLGTGSDADLAQEEIDYDAPDPTPVLDDDDVDKDGDPREVDLPSVVETDGEAP